ncbi:hypothetical protein MFC_01454 [Mesomycoplasma flocculare ATCC 27716]|nr:hypothetical protein MFC_01454 [Mesomycoplasma flocculare ATCC 27716]
MIILLPLGSLILLFFRFFFSLLFFFKLLSCFRFYNWKRRFIKIFSVNFIIFFELNAVFILIIIKSNLFKE